MVLAVLLAFQAVFAIFRSKAPHPVTGLSWLSSALNIIATSAAVFVSRIEDRRSISPSSLLVLYFSAASGAVSSPFPVCAHYGSCRLHRLVSLLGSWSLPSISRLSLLNRCINSISNSRTEMQQRRRFVAFGVGVYIFGSCRCLSRGSQPS